MYDQASGYDFDDRIHEWAKGEGLRADTQVAFRRDHNIVNNAFVLRTLIEHCKERDKPSQQKKMPCTCFVDFKKAFDLVPRDLL